jgi:hypothetical protein
MAQTVGVPSLDIERDIRSEIRNAHTSAASAMVDAPELAMPDYVEHRPGVSEIGKLSAEAMLREYEATAKEIESIGVDLLERIKRYDTIARDALAVTTELKEIARRYREEAKRAFEHIESCSLMVAEAQKTCSDLKDKLSVSLPMEKAKPKRK